MLSAPTSAQHRSELEFHFLLCFSPSPLIGWKSKAQLAPPAWLSLPAPAGLTVCAVPCHAVLCHAGLALASFLLQPPGFGL